MPSLSFSSSYTELPLGPVPRFVRPSSSIPPRCRADFRKHSWPVYTPAPKLADWLESYAQSLELNVWMSTSVTSATFDDAASEWTVELERGVDGKTEQRTLKPKIIVWACGLGGGEPKMPVIEGMVRCGRAWRRSER